MIPYEGLLRLQTIVHTPNTSMVKTIVILSHVKRTTAGGYARFPFKIRSVTRRYLCLNCRPGLRIGGNGMKKRGLECFIATAKIGSHSVSVEIDENKVKMMIIIQTIDDNRLRPSVEILKLG